MVDVVAAAQAELSHASDTPARVAYAGGGAAANVAAWLGELGAPVALVARIGDDLVGRGAVEELRDRGVDTRVRIDFDHPTGTCIVLVEPGGERTMLPDRGANLHLTPGDLPDDLFVAGAHLHLSGYVLLDPSGRDAGLAALSLARERGMTISVDPASEAPLRACPPSAFLEMVRGVDLLLPNLDEARALTGLDDPSAAAEALLPYTREAVVKFGPGGAVWTDGTEVVRVEAPVVDALDTTGAGDAFAAGLLAARYAGAPSRAALSAACSTGARAVTVTGARPLRR